MIRNRLLRRLLVAVFLLVGPLTQFQSVFACELMDDGASRIVCCCDEPGAMGMACEMDGTCQGQPATIEGNCCDVSYQASQVAQVSSGHGAHAQQVVMLDAPQPPPIPASYAVPELVQTGYLVDFSTPFFLPLPDKPVYLLTNRFRI